jgi:hypothetical protein
MTSPARKTSPQKASAKSRPKIILPEGGAPRATAKQMAARKRFVAEHEAAHGKIPRARVIAIKAEWRD